MKETVEGFLANAGPYAQTTACLVCEKVENAPLAVLAPLLLNRENSTGELYRVHSEGNDYLPFRICDRAYETISRLLGDEQTVATGTPEEMDAKIETLVKRLQGDPARWTFTATELKTRQRDRSRNQKGDR
jgi:hypothetical protein